jgi:tetratricopeptide (TPR) repeat protein
VDRILARSYCLQGNALRLVGDRQGAEQCFQKASSSLTGPPGSIERAYYCQRLASLREEQGNFDEATALLWRAAGIFNEAGASEEQGDCLCRLAFLFFHEHDLARASRLFAQARGLLSFEGSPALAARCGLGLATCLAALGQREQARRLRKESRPLGDSVTDGRDLLEIDWLEGRLATRLGEPDEASARLSSVRRRLLQQKRLLDAALCSLDLARVFAETGQEERIGGLIDELHRGFPVSLDQVRMLIALHDFQRSAQAGADLEGAAREAIELIRRPAAILKKL